MNPRIAFAALLASSVLSFGCSKSTDAANDAGAVASDDTDADTDAAPVDEVAAELPNCTRDTVPDVTETAVGNADPYATTAFTLDLAMAGFTDGAGSLTAAIKTEKGVIVCTLDDVAAPVSVSNFIGLARGTRPARSNTGKWVTKRFYDGLIFHRVIPNFVVQGGDPQGLGTGGPGFDLPNENHAAEPLGALAMAAGESTDADGGAVFVPSGSQFYVVVGKGPSADYNVFGTCLTDVAKTIAAVKTDANDAPVTKVHIQRVDIFRCPN